MTSEARLAKTMKLPPGSLEMFILGVASFYARGPVTWRQPY